MTRRGGLILALAAVATAAHADPHVLRFATAGPDGSAWARLIRSIGEDALRSSKGAVTIKWYFGGVAGDENEAARRMRAGQLDGVISGGPFCEEVMPSMRVLGIPALFQDRDESAYVMHALRAQLIDEAQRAGFELLGTTGLGPTVIFSRQPVRSMADLRALRLWDWDLFSREIAAERQMGIGVVAAPVEQAAAWYDQGKLDGFIGVPAAALAFQWSARARYITDLRTRYLTACVLLRHDSFDKLPLDQQDAVRASFARADARFEDLGRQQDDQLLGGLFARQGLAAVPVSEAFRSQFFEAARKARKALGDALVTRDLLARTEQMLADYRAEHRMSGADRRAR